MKKRIMPIILLILGLVILILRNQNCTDIMIEVNTQFLCLLGIIVFLISLLFNILSCIFNKSKFNFFLIASFLIISFVIWANSNEIFKSKIKIFAHSDGSDGFMSELILRENNKYEFKKYEFKHLYKIHGEYKMNQDTLLLDNCECFNRDLWYSSYSKYLIDGNKKRLIPIKNGKVLMYKGKILIIIN